MIGIVCHGDDVPERGRIKRVRAGLEWEMTFAPDGRATFEYGKELVEGEAHVIWRRVGGHGVLAEP